MMNKKFFLNSLIATAAISISGSTLAFHTEHGAKNQHQAVKKASTNAQQQLSIELKDKGNGNYYFPYNFYNPRHIRNKNNLQQVGSEVSDELLDQLTEQASTKDVADSKNELSKKNKNRTFGYPENYNHPAFLDVREVTSGDSGELKYDLNVQYADHKFTTLQQGKQVTKDLRLRSYDGEMVGPTFVVKPGDTLKIRLNNLLPPEMHRMECDMDDPNAHCDHTTPHAFNTTNLHTHGLHVDPTGNSDNVFIKLEGGESFDYEIHIPEDHSAGTFWYHAHVHGSTTVQVGSGVHGAIIVRGDYDEIPEIKQAKERVMVLQTIAFNEEGTIEDNEDYFVEKWHPEGWNNGWHYSLNGQVMPEIVMQPGSTELWRFVHAGIREYTNLELVDACDTSINVPLVQLAADGIPFRKKRLSDDKGAFIAPGYRSDIMVKPRRRGVYYLIDTSVAGADQLPDSYCHERREGDTFTLDETAQNIIARVTVTGERKRMRLPRNKKLKKLNRPAIIKDNELSSDVEYTVFNIAPKDGVDPSDESQFVGANFDFTINGKTYDPHSVRRLKFGTAQTWKLSSDFFFHPYHIHVNPFEVLTRNEEGKIVDRYWRDTVMVWPADEGQDPAEAELEIRTRYEKFTGSFVMHCHILDHEDRGMMEKVEIYK
ncbi:multicopper oxidase family protein [Thalassomonas haliotis]|uniref:Multicopper oxidase domain-containing protein n=1 Tax=Thalassomonas haliotis TaxID=485448 RepID=A0ABY7VF30_9GAMM|nr:multicopper oxidase family protein [Thalassomonas haliotis]WDE11992.1 multicopper oxidase domain-containing protein [Thalassomonas haliotis]